MVVFTILALLLGVTCGLLGGENRLLAVFTEHTDLILYILMFSVGISVGMHRGILEKTAGISHPYFSDSGRDYCRFHTGRCSGFCLSGDSRRAGSGDRQRNGMVQPVRRDDRPSGRRGTGKYCLYEQSYAGNFFFCINSDSRRETELL